MATYQEIRAEMEAAGDRVAATPVVVRELRALADAARTLADSLENEPGSGLGLGYAPVWNAWVGVETSMRYYQNTLRDPGARSPR